jgi:very-short-patch-repair endonuclease
MLASVARDGAFRQQLAPSPGAVDETHRIGAQSQPRSSNGAAVDEMHPRDRAILAMAARQHGIVTTAQLLNAGVGRRSIARRVARGWLVPLYRGVYQVGPVAARYGAEMAAVLACGDGALLSHHSAAAIWGILPAHKGDVHVTVSGQARRSRPGVRVHRSLSLNAADRNGLPLTTPARTLKDLARHLPSKDLDRATEQAHILGLVIPDGAPEPGFTRSEAERRLKALVKAAGLPMPRTNARVEGWEVDAYWPAQRLIVEVDGYEFHGTRQAFERDRRKDAALTAAGYRVVRITWRRLTTEPYSVSAQLGALLTLG